MSSIIRATTTNGLQIAPDNSGSLQLQTNGTTTAVTIDTSQNVGIGTTTPDGKFQIVAANKITDATGIANFFTTDTAATNIGGSIGLGGATGQATANFVFGTIAGRYQGSGYSGYLQFATTASNGTVTERMRIDSSGNVRIGTTAGIGSEKLTVTNSASAEAVFFVNSNATPYGVTTYYTGATPNNTTSAFYTATDGTTRFQVRSNGGIANYSANNVNLSDQREKTNIELASSYLDKICSIPVKTFNYIDQNMEEDGGLTLGVIAQDVQAVAPELIMESNWAGKDEPEKLRLSIYQTDLQYALMKCIQEQQTIINDLKARIETLEAK